MKMDNPVSERLLLGETFPVARWESIFLKIFRKQIPPEDIKSLLLLLSKRGEQAPEISGCVRAIRRLEPPRRFVSPFLIDVSGTGGDGQGTFNVSTVSSFVIAAAGGFVAKHGNRSVSSRVGSSDLMEALGIRWNIPAPRMLEALGRYHLGYFHAPLYHPIFANVQEVRRGLGTRTLFNSLGPLVNPLEIRYQAIGVSNSKWLEPMARALGRLPRHRAVVFRSRDGLDELSTGEVNDIVYTGRGRMKRLTLDPKKLGFRKAHLRDYRGGDLKTNLGIAVGILSNRIRGPKLDIVLLNSGFALWLAGLAGSVREGIERSRFVIRKGLALQVLDGLRRFTGK